MVTWWTALVAIAVTVPAGTAKPAAPPSAPAANPATLPAVDLSWLPPLTVGARSPAFLAQPTDRALVRKPWCDFGRHAQRRAAGAVGTDPIFRRPSAEAKQALAAIREELLNPADFRVREAAETKLATLLATDDGPAIYKGLAQDQSVYMQTIAARGAKAQVRAHPRLAAFATGLLAAADPALALAVVELHLNAICDTPVQYGVDGFKHPDERVQLATLREVYRISREMENLRLPDRVLAWMLEGRGSARARVVALRMTNALGWQSAWTAVLALSADKNEHVAAEAFVVACSLQPGWANTRVPKWLKDKSPVKRAAAIRGFVAAFPDRADLVQTWLHPLASDKALVPDPYGVNGGPRVVSDLVAQAEAAVLVK